MPNIIIIIIIWVSNWDNFTQNLMEVLVYFFNLRRKLLNFKPGVKIMSVSWLENPAKHFARLLIDPTKIWKYFCFSCLFIGFKLTFLHMIYSFSLNVTGCVFKLLDFTDHQLLTLKQWLLNHNRSFLFFPCNEMQVLRYSFLPYKCCFDLFVRLWYILPEYDFRQASHLWKF